MDELKALMDKRARLLASYFGHVSPLELAHRYNPLPFGLRSGKYGPLA